VRRALLVTVACRLPIDDWIADCRLPIDDWIADYRVAIDDFGDRRRNPQSAVANSIDSGQSPIDNVKSGL
jgi:hypothetical protein